MMGVISILLLCGIPVFFFTLDPMLGVVTAFPIIFGSPLLVGWWNMYGRDEWNWFKHKIRILGEKEVQS